MNIRNIFQTIIISGILKHVIKSLSFKTREKHIGYFFFNLKSPFKSSPGVKLEITTTTKQTY